MNTDYIDLYQIHGFDSVTPLEETMSALTDVVRQGKVRYIGCSNLAAWQIMKSLGISALQHLEKFITLQAYYSIAGRELEREILPMLMDQKIGLLVWSPLAGGILSGKFTRAGASDNESRRSKFSFPPVNLEKSLRHRRCDAGRGEPHQRDGGASRAGMAAAPAVRQQRNHRSEEGQPAEGQSRLRGSETGHGRLEEAGRSQQADARVSQLDVRDSGIGPPARPSAGLVQVRRRNRKIAEPGGHSTAVISFIWA